jgi:hypothetical protein
MPEVSGGCVGTKVSVGSVGAELSVGSVGVGVTRGSVMESVAVSRTLPIEESIPRSVVVGADVPKADVTAALI